VKKQRKNKGVKYRFCYSGRFQNRLGTQVYCQAWSESLFFLVFRGFLFWERFGLMARLARAGVFASGEVAIVHVMNRTVRRCF